MNWSVIVLAAGVLCALSDQVLGVRLYQGGERTLRERAAFAWKERRLTIVGSLLVLIAIPLEAAGV